MHGDYTIPLTGQLSEVAFCRDVCKHLLARVLAILGIMMKQLCGMITQHIDAMHTVGHE